MALNKSFQMCNVANIIWEEIEYITKFEDLGAAKNTFIC